MATDYKRARVKPMREPEPFEAEPAWEIARLFPAQGYWSEGDYFSLPTNKRVEFADGSIEVLPMPTTAHQLIVAFLFEFLKAFANSRRPKLGTALFAPLPVRLRDGKYREPDVVFMLAEHASRIGNNYWDGADLVMEVVSESNRRHDLETKWDEYARAGIPEYWIIDPEEETITVLVLKPRRKTYSEHGTFRKGTRAASKLLPGFSVDVTEALTQRP
jgi:Uma2 family endonuclease